MNMRGDYEAFPQPIHPNANGEMQRACDYNGGGMDLRTYVATAALQGLLANPGGPVQANGMSGFGFTNCTTRQVAELAVILADELVDVLNKPQEVKP